MSYLPIDHEEYERQLARPKYAMPIGFEEVKGCVDALLESLAYFGSDREVKIIKLRNGLVDGRKWTLDGIGRELGVTRERVRQVEAKAIRKLRRRATLLPSEQLDDCICKLMSFGDLVGENFASDGFIRTFAVAEDVAETSVSAHVGLLQTMATDCHADRRPLDEVDSFIVRTLAESSNLLFLDELWELIRSDPEACAITADWPELDLSMRLQLVLHVLIDSDGSCTATDQTLLRLNSTDRRLIALTRVLREAEEPLHFTEIARRARPLLIGELVMSERNVHAWMDRYKDRFKWAGRGIYGLSEWDIGVRDGNLKSALQSARRVGIGDEIALLLSERNEPVSLGYLEDHILGRFEVSKASVYASITQDAANRFFTLDNDMVALSAWNKGPLAQVTRVPRQRVRIPNDLRDTARLTARRKVSDLNYLLGRGTATVTPAKATGYAVVAAALGLAYEFDTLLEVAGASNMPASMSDALRRFSES